MIPGQTLLLPGFGKNEEDVLCTRAKCFHAFPLPHHHHQDGLRSSTSTITLDLREGVKATGVLGRSWGADESRSTSHLPFIPPEEEIAQDLICVNSIKFPWLGWEKWLYCGAILATARHET